MDGVIRKKKQTTYGWVVGGNSVASSFIRSLMLYLRLRSTAK